MSQSPSIPVLGMGTEFEDGDPFSCFGSDSSDNDSEDDDTKEDKNKLKVNVNKSRTSDEPTTATTGFHSNSSTTTNNNKINNKSNNARPPSYTVSDFEQSRRLMVVSAAKQVNAATEHVPLVGLDDNNKNKQQNTNFEVFDDRVNGRGMGVRVLRSYSMGDEILREGAAFRICNSQRATTHDEAELKFSSSVQLAFDALAPATARAVMELSSCHETVEYDDDDDDEEEKVEGDEEEQGTNKYIKNKGKKNNKINKKKTPLGIYRTNSFELLGETDGGLFLTISRINHSCRPNVLHSWRPDLQQTLIMAARDLSAGEEICTSYGPSECLATEERREYLNDRFAFDCQCDMCCEGNELGGDDRMMELSALHEDISLFAASNMSHDAIKAIDLCLALLQQQGIGTSSVCKPIFNWGYQISLTGLHDAVLARSYLVQQLQAVRNSEGAGSYNAMDTQQMLNELDLDILHYAEKVGPSPSECP
jgi:hypothetical protein